MKIEDVLVYDLRFRLKEEEHLGISQGWICERRATIVQVITDEGIVGWGEGGNPAEIIERISPSIVGADPFDVKKMWIGDPEKEAGLRPSAYFGVEMALWDIMGKKIGVPVSKLLGGQLRERIKVYASSLYFKRVRDLPETFAEEATRYLDQGFDAIKIKIGYSPERDLRCVRAVRDAVGEEAELMVDAQKAYNSHTAVRLGRKLEKHDVYWFEEPVPPYDLEGYVEVRNALDMAVAGGESLVDLHEFSRFIAGKAFDIVQPDMWAGGIGGCREIATLAEAFNVAYVPHCWATQITVAAWLHLLSSIPPYPRKVNPELPLLEYDVSLNPIRDEILTTPIRLQKSCIEVPNKPGLGVEINEKTLGKYAVR